LQNPVGYFNGTGYLNVCGRKVALFEDGHYIGLEETRSRLRHHRDEVVEPIRLARPDLTFPERRSTDAEQRVHTREIVEMLSGYSASSSEST
jgi:hypothetical protein